LKSNICESRILSVQDSLYQLGVNQEYLSWVRNHGTVSDVYTKTHIQLM